ncbi:MAG: hypothetical protein AAFV29_24245, partial [Myxococcota bacterium]
MQAQAPGITAYDIFHAMLADESASSTASHQLTSAPIQVPKRGQLAVATIIADERARIQFSDPNAAADFDPTLASIAPEDMTETDLLAILNAPGVTIDIRVSGGDVTYAVGDVTIATGTVPSPATVFDEGSRLEGRSPLIERSEPDAVFDPVTIKALEDLEAAGENANDSTVLYRAVQLDALNNGAAMVNPDGGGSYQMPDGQSLSSSEFFASFEEIDVGAAHFTTDFESAQQALRPGEVLVQTSLKELKTLAESGSVVLARDGANPTQLAVVARADKQIPIDLDRSLATAWTLALDTGRVNPTFGGSRSVLELLQAAQDGRIEILANGLDRAA